MMCNCYADAETLQQLLDKQGNNVFMQEKGEAWRTSEVLTLDLVIMYHIDADRGQVCGLTHCHRFLERGQLAQDLPSPGSESPQLVSSILQLSTENIRCKWSCFHTSISEFSMCKPGFKGLQETNPVGFRTKDLTPSSVHEFEGSLNPEP